MVTTMGIHKMEDYHIGKAIKANFDKIHEFQKSKGALLTGLPTGFTRLDRITSGLNKGDLIILASCPYMGKTAFALNIARNLSVDNDIPVLIFSLIDTREQLSMRMLSAESRVEFSRIKSGELGDTEWEQLRKAGEVLSKAPIYIDATPGNSIMDMEMMADVLKENAGTCLITIDYLQLITRDPEAPNPRTERIEMVERLKRLAGRLDILVMVLYQLNIEIDERSNKRPNIIDLADADSIEQYFDLVLFIYRDEVYQICKDHSNRGRVEIIVGKNRNGPTGMATLSFIRQCSLFTDFKVGKADSCS
jgi:replicative DNA helicase